MLSLSDVSHSGYFPETSESILVVAPQTAEQAQVEFAVTHNNAISAASWVLPRKRDSWTANKVDEWVHNYKSLHAHHMPTHILLTSAHYKKNGSIYNAQ